MNADNATDNPFSIRRWEFETEHVVWVPAKARDVLGQTPCHIQGVRGSGKTALLRVADYYTRRSDQVRLFNRENIIDRCLGIYVSFIDEFTEFLNADSAGVLYYDYTILYCISKICDLLDDASRDAVLNYREHQERAVIKSLVARHEIVRSGFEEVTSFTTLASYLRRHCRHLRNESITVGLYSQSTHSHIDGRQFFDDICVLLKEQKILYSHGGSFFIKVCVDDAHLSSPSAQRKLNNILYRSQYPIFWNIAFVEGQFDPYDIDTTVKYVTEHDRKLIDLNYREDPATFQEICEKVFELRVNRHLRQNGDSASGAMSVLKKYIGRIPFDDMFSNLINRSNKSSLLAEIRQFHDVLIEKIGVNRGVKSYHAFVARCIFDTPEAFKAFCAGRDVLQIDNYFRQKGGAAIVVAARMLDLAVPYEGLNTLFFLSDGCLRDFLSLCSALLEVDQGRPEGRRAFFRGNKVATDTQTRAFRAYSTAFVRGLHNPRQPYAQQLSSLIEGIGRLTFLLQTESPKLACTQPDLGLFRLDFDPEQRGLFVEDDESTIGSIREVLKEAIYTGAVRLERGNVTHGDSLEFRLSGVMAPHFQTSPRKPMRTVTLSFLDVASLVHTPGTIEAQKWAQKCFQRWQYTQHARGFDDDEMEELL